MSRPVADEFQRVSERLFFWQAYDPACKADLSSAAYRIAHGLVLVDPVLLADEALEELAAVSEPHAVICTNGNHARAADEYRKRFDIPVMCTAAAADELETKADHILATGKAWCGLEVLAVPGAGPGELALLAPGDTLMLGDCVINLEDHGFSLLPKKYCTDARRLPQSIAGLCVHSFQRVTFAHGTPLLTNARGQIRSLV